MKDKTVAYLLWCAAFVGAAGLQRIYCGKYGTGFLYLFTWGLLGVGQFIDLFTIPGMVEDANNRLLVQSMGGLGAVEDAKRPAGLLGRRVPRTTDEFQVSLAQAAEAHGGALTVAEAVAATGRGFKDVEKELNRMAVAGYVGVENEEETGVLVYRFRGAKG